MNADNYKMKLLGFLLGIIVLGTFAFLDDVKDLKPWQKLIAQVASAVIVWVCGIRIDIINGWVLPQVFMLYTNCRMDCRNNKCN